MMEDNIPLGIAQFYDSQSQTTELSWSYVENADIEFFEIEYYDEDKRKWMPFDGRSGIVKKQQ